MTRLQYFVGKVAVLGLLALAWQQASGEQRIADAWFAHNAIVTMLGGANQVVVTVARPSTYPWMYRVAPALYHATVVDGTTLNSEELRRQNVNLVFVPKSYQTANALQRSGFRVVSVGFEDFPSMLACIEQTAQILGTPLAQQRARAYSSYLAQSLATVRAATVKVPLNKRPRVLHILSLDPLVVDGEDTIIDQWIREAGGRNAAVGLKGTQRQVSAEQVLSWQPDVIILAANAGTIETSHNRAIFESLDCVRLHHVYRNPAGVFPWDRYGPELALQLQWAASILEPQVMKQAMVNTKVRAFYKEFFGYDLDAAAADQILRGAGGSKLPPNQGTANR